MREGGVGVALGRGVQAAAICTGSVSWWTAERGVSLCERDVMVDGSSQLACGGVVRAGSVRDDVVGRRRGAVSADRGMCAQTMR